jgi:pimeloyl-ACP methyl ester carboxylesterase
MMLIERFLDRLDWDNLFPYQANAQWHIHQAEPRVTRGILDRASLFGKPTTVTLIGHSWGSLVALDACRTLQQAGIDVDYLAAIDPTALFPNQEPMKVPTNVVQCDEFLATRGFPARARRRCERMKLPVGSLGGQYQYPHPLFPPKRYKATYDTGHIALARNSVVVNRIVKQVSNLIEEWEIANVTD